MEFTTLEEMPVRAKKHRELDTSIDSIKFLLKEN